MGLSEFDPAARERLAWNAGHKVGAKRALKPRQIWAVRFFLGQTSVFGTERCSIMLSIVSYGLGRAFIAMRRRLGDPALLGQGRDVLTWAIALFARVGMTEHAASARFNLIEVKADIAHRNGDPAQMREVILSMNEAVTLLSHRGLSQAEAHSLGVLADLFLTYANFEDGSKYIGAAIAAHWRIVRDTSRELEPLQWGAAQDGLGRALLALGTR